MLLSLIVDVAEPISPPSMTVADLIKLLIGGAAGTVIIVVPLFHQIIKAYANKLLKRIEGTDTTGPAVATLAKLEEVKAKQDRHSDEFKEFKTKVESDVGTIRKELTTNGGGTLKDYIDAVRASVDGVNNKLRVMATTNNSIVWESDAQGGSVWASPAMCRALQREFDDIRGQAWKSFVHEPDRGKVISEWESCVREKRAFRMSYHWVRADGYLLRIHAEAHPIRTRSGDVDGWIATVVLVGDPIAPGGESR